jgi:hypothetical protein
LGIGFQTMLTAFLADLLAVNRRLMEDIQYRVKVAEISSALPSPEHPVVPSRSNPREEEGKVGYDESDERR